MNTKFLAFLCVFPVLLTCSCSNDEEPCTQEGTFSSAFFNGSSSGPMINPGRNNITENQLYYDYYLGPPMRAVFFITGRRTDICVNKHVKVQADIVTTVDLQPREIEMNIYSDWKNGDFTQDKSFFKGFADPLTTYTGSDEVGLKEAYPEGGAVLFTNAEVIFETLGSFSQDSAYFMEHIASMKVHYTYSK